MARTLFDDEEFLDHLVGLLIHDAETLRNLRPLLEADDFKPVRGMQWGQQRWVVGERALHYYERFHQPLGKLLRADIIEYAQGLQLNERQVELLEDYIKRIHSIKLNGAGGVTEKVVAYKTQRIKAATIQELIDLQSIGQLTDEKWLELSQRAVNVKNGHLPAISYFDSLEERITQRSMKRKFHNPVLMIEPLDNLLFPGLAPKQLGLVIAPTSRGKSLLLLWIALVYTLQRLNVLYFTLEDSGEDSQNRLDSMITGVPFVQLEERPLAVRSHFASYHRLIDSKFHMIDGSHEKYTVAKIEQRIQEQRDLGFPPDAVIIDYDKFIRGDATIKSNSQVEIMDNVYQDLRQLASRQNLLLWIAAQTQRNTEKLKILTGDKVAEAIEKVRKTVIAISLGKGELTDDSLYVWVAKNKFGKRDWGCHIIPDLERSLIYDHERTRKALNEVKAQEEQNEEYPTS